MGVLSTNPTSRRGYLSQDELEQLADITVTDSTEADDRISQAEELVDAYCRHVNKFLEYEVVGRVVSSASTSITLQADQQNVYEQDFFKWCEVEIISGTGEGQRRKVTTSTKAGVLTVDTAWTTNPTSSSYYRIYQLGKFPRNEDVQLYSTSSPYVYLKSIPEAVKRAVAAQVEFAIEMGDAFFKGENVDMQSESIGDYSYTKGESSGGNLERLISSKSKSLLRGYRNRTGRIVL